MEPYREDELAPLRAENEKLTLEVENLKRRHVRIRLAYVAMVAALLMSLGAITGVATFNIVYASECKPPPSPPRPYNDIVLEQASRFVAAMHPGEPIETRCARVRNNRDSICTAIIGGHPVMFICNGTQCRVEY